MATPEVLREETALAAVIRTETPPGSQTERIPPEDREAVRVPGGIRRCQEEIEAILEMLRAGNPDMHGLLFGLQDWSCELRLLTQQNG